MATNPMKDKTLILKISETQDLSLDDLLTRAKGGVENWHQITVRTSSES